MDGSKKEIIEWLQDLKSAALDSGKQNAKKNADLIQLRIDTLNKEQ